MGTVLEMDGWVWMGVDELVWMVDGRVGVNEGLAVLRTDCTTTLLLPDKNRVVRVRVRVRARERGEEVLLDTRARDSIVSPLHKPCLEPNCSYGTVRRLE